MKTTVRAFTILEVTITMVIAGLLIGLTYTSYTIIAKFYHAFKDKNDRMAVLVSLDHVLARDFDRAEIILRKTDGITIKNSSRTIKYTFNLNFITRNDFKTDTFMVQPVEIKYFFQQAPVSEVNEREEQNRLDEVSFTVVFTDQKIPYHYYKQYSSDNLIKRNSNAGN